MSDALKRGTVEYAEWLADKLHNTNDFGKEAAVLLVKQVTELEALRKNDARYRWLRESKTFGGDLMRERIFNDYCNEGLDAAIDAAMESTK